LFFIACKKKNNPDLDQLERIAVDIGQKEKAVDGTFLIDTTFFEIVVLETNPECLIGEIAKVHLRGDKILIYDELTKSVLIFNRDGSYYAKMHALGNGPGEYPPAINDIVIMDAYIGVLTPVLNKILLYNFEGKYEKEIPLRGTWGDTFFTFDNNTYYIVNSGSNSDQGRYRLFSLDIDRKNVKRFLPFPEEPEGINQGWGLTNYYSLYNNRALIIYSMTDIIYELTPDKDIAPRYYVDIVKNKLPQRIIEGEGLKALQTAQKENYLTGVNKIMETKHYIILDISNKFRVVYDKQQRQVITTAETLSLGDKKGFPIYLFQSSSTMENDRLINIVDADMALYVYKEFHNEKTLKIKQFAKKYTEAVNKLNDEEDNPILIIYHTN
jgi:hypothetical protein